MTSIKFSAQPGAYERQLKRKHNNPLFSSAAQQISAQDVAQAQIRDQQDRNAYLESFQTTVKEAAGLEGSVESEVLLDLKEQLERLYVHGTSLFNEDEPQQQALRKLIDICMASIQKGAQDDPGALRKIQEEIAAREVYFELLKTKMVADLMRGDDIIHETELIPCLLSESPDGLTTVMELFEPAQQIHLIALAKEYIQQLDEATRESTQCESRLQQMLALSAASESNQPN